MAQLHSLLSTKFRSWLFRVFLWDRLWCELVCSSWQLRGCRQDQPLVLINCFWEADDEDGDCLCVCSVLGFTVAQL